MTLRRQQLELAIAENLPQDPQVMLENALVKESTNRNIICLLSPIGYDENHIKTVNGSISIIGYEMYCLIKEYSGFKNVSLYNPYKDISDDDVLLVLMCLPNVPIELLKKFKNIVYFFDDMNEWKAVYEGYKEKFELVDIYISPVKAVADEMNELGRKRSFYVPWSMRPPLYPIVKSSAPCIFIDMDERDFTKQSINNGFEFASECINLGLSVFAFERFKKYYDNTIVNNIIFINQMPHDNFLEFMSKMWFYATGIHGSYEYCILESALLGCGLVSLDSAVLTEHTNRDFFFDQRGDPSFWLHFQSAIRSFDPRKIRLAAETLYPRDASRQLQEIFDRCSL